MRRHDWERSVTATLSSATAVVCDPSCMHRIATIGAYDRFNYGDLLFPKVLDCVANDSELAPLIHMAVVGVDMRPKGGHLVQSTSRVTGSTAFAPRGLIVGGGEVLSATWSQALINLIPYPLDFVFRALRKTFGVARTDPVARLLLRGEWATPYVPSPEYCVEVPVAFNAVGASSLPNLRGGALDSVIGALTRARFVSVRDEIGLKAVRKFRADASLAPDSAAILRRIFPTSGATERTLVFQCSHQWLWDSSSVLDQLTDLSTEFDKVVLLPIGLAGGHGDHHALRSVQRQLAARGLDVEFPDTDVTVESIVTEIGGASLFVGSSLHGAITSMAFGVPHVALDNVDKLTAYLQTWGDSLTPHDVPAAEIAAAGRKALGVSRDQLMLRAARLEQLAWANTQRVLESVDAAADGRKCD